MKKRIKALTAAAIATAAAALLTLCACSANSGANSGADSSANPDDVEADTVVYGNIETTTLTGDFVQTEAMAIKDGKIYYIGNKDGAQAYVASKTEVKDFGSSTVLPGFIDGHTHAYVSAENKVCDFNLTECKSAEDCVKVISDYVEKNPKDFYIGYGWLDVMFENGQPTADLLDAIKTESPIYIKSEDCHSCWTNTAMMKKCGITKDSENPAGGVIERTKSGEPSGCFRDTAMDVLIKPNVPVYTVDQYKEILLLAQDEYIGLGYTAYNDVIIDETSAENIVKAYHELDKEGKLKCYINASYIVNNNDKALDNIKNIAKLAKEVDGEHFKLTDVKFFMDGITESCTSYMNEAYLNDTSNYGVDRWKGKESTQRLYDAATLCNDLGLVAHFHAIGDAAVGKALDAAEYAKKNSKNADIRNCMTHIQFITDDDAKRFADLNMIASCDLGWCYTDNAELNDDPNYQNIEFTNLGEDRVDTEMRYKTLLDNGVTVAFATDYPATATVDPFKCIEFGVTRMYDGMESTVNNAKEALTVEDAVRAITVNSATQLQRDEQIGSLEAGKQANFIVISNDIMKCDSTDIYGENTKLESVYIDGNEVLAKK